MRVLKVRQKLGTAKKLVSISYFLAYPGEKPYLIRQDEYQTYLNNFLPEASEYRKEVFKRIELLSKEFKIDKVEGFPEKLQKMTEKYNQRLEKLRNGRKAIPKHKSLDAEQIQAAKDKKREYNTIKVRQYRWEKKNDKN